MASKVYFTDFRTGLGTSLTVKLQKLIRQAGIGQIAYFTMDTGNRHGEIEYVIGPAF